MPLCNVLELCCLYLQVLLFYRYSWGAGYGSSDRMGGYSYGGY